MSRARLLILALLLGLAACAAPEPVCDREGGIGGTGICGEEQS